MMKEAVISASPGRFKLEGASIRRNSTGTTIIRSPLSSANSEKKPLPRYMRASTSSCHDFCKFGRHHAFEEEAKSSVSRKVVRKMEVPPEGQRKVKDGNARERKKTIVIKLKAAPEPKMKLSERSQLTKKMAPSPVKKTEVSAKPAVILKPKPNPKTKPVAAIVSSPSKFPIVGPSARRYSDPTVPGSAGSCSAKKPMESVGAASGGRGSHSRTVKNTKSPKTLQKKELKPPMASLSSKATVNGLASIKPYKLGYPKLISTANNDDKLQRHRCGDDIERTVYAIEPEPSGSSLGHVEHDCYSPQSSSLPSLMSLSLPSFSSSTSLSSDGEAADTKEEVNDKKAEAEERDNEAEGEEVENEDDEEEEQEEEGGEDYDSSIDGAEYSDCEQDGTKTEKGEISNGSQARQRSSMVHPAGQNCSPQKLKFRRGTVINPQSEENGPRRLRFRRGRVVGNTANGKLEMGKRSIRRRELGGSGDSSTANADAPSVMLRHKGVQGKKEEQGLFNDVIEVTASKLAETRKSKVKALVGAFETVISLQDSKPATTV